MMMRSITPVAAIAALGLTPALASAAPIATVYPESDVRFNGPISGGQADSQSFGYSPSNRIRVGDDNSDNIFRAGFKFAIDSQTRQAIANAPKVELHLQSNGGQWSGGIDGVSVRGYQGVGNAGGFSSFNVNAGEVQLGDSLYTQTQTDAGISIDVTNWAKEEVVGTSNQLGLNVVEQINSTGESDGNGNQIYLYGGEIGEYAGPADGRARIEVVPEPTSLALLGLGGLAMTFGRRRARSA
jgi:hypothetical protein